MRLNNHLFGILNVNKPRGVTSRAVVNQVQRLLKPAKVGHAGTLDPLATGVLILCVGPATRLVEYVQRMAKGYRGEFLLGRQSDTEDVTGHVVELTDSPQPSPSAIEQAARRLVGVIQQRPPAYSALKIRGRRAYDLARSGQQVELQPRQVSVHDVRVVRYQYPKLTLDVECGSGTYIRSLGRDLAESLGTAAVMSSLRRTKIGDFKVQQSWPIEDISSENIGDLLQPATLAVPDLPKIQLSAQEIQRLRNGMFIANPQEPTASEVAGVDSQGQLIAILVPRGRGELRPVRNFDAS